MTIMKTASDSTIMNAIPWVAKPSYRRVKSLPNAPKTPPRTNIHTLESAYADKPATSTDAAPAAASVSAASAAVAASAAATPAAATAATPSAVTPVVTTYAAASAAPAAAVAGPADATPAAAVPATAAPAAADDDDAGFKSYIQDISTQEDIDDELCLPLSYQFMFDKRTSPWEMQDWDHDELNAFIIQAENIDRLYHMVANDEDPNFRTWEICCRMDYKGEKYFVEMYANCDYTGFDCQGGGYICITKLPDFFLSNMVTMDQNPDQIYKALLEDGYNVQEPDPLHKMHPKFWNNAPMLKYLCHNAIYKNKDILCHFKEQLPQVLANSVDDFIKVKEWENE